MLALARKVIRVPLSVANHEEEVYTQGIVRYASNLPSRTCPRSTPGCYTTIYPSSTALSMLLLDESVLFPVPVSKSNLSVRCSFLSHLHHYGLMRSDAKSAGNQPTASWQAQHGGEPRLTFNPLPEWFDITHEMCLWLHHKTFRKTNRKKQLHRN
jgi:hypothetical protein